MPQSNGEAMSRNRDFEFKKLREKQRLDHAKQWLAEVLHKEDAIPDEHMRRLVTKVGLSPMDAFICHSLARGWSMSKIAKRCGCTTGIVSGIRDRLGDAIQAMRMKNEMHILSEMPECNDAQIAIAKRTGRKDAMAAVGAYRNLAQVAHPTGGGTINIGGDHSKYEDNRSVTVNLEETKKLGLAEILKQQKVIEAEFEREPPPGAVR